MLEAFCIGIIGFLGIGGGIAFGIIFDSFHEFSVREVNQADVDATIKSLRKRGASTDYLDNIQRGEIERFTRVI
ncbi:MAG: hypothetical protein NTY33_01965 [Candidatus Moranbacteria bacterium]|nr:hypothetical protein [Candidatus Moranbacteria bacterium]